MNPAVWLLGIALALLSGVFVEAGSDDSTVMELTSMTERFKR